jgi:hypothetical protein
VKINAVRVYRQYDAGMMTIGHTVLASLMIPPKSKDFMIVGHCGAECTDKGVPQEGIFMFNLLLHTHLAGLFGNNYETRSLMTRVQTYLKSYALVFYKSI